MPSYSSRNTSAPSSRSSRTITTPPSTRPSGSYTMHGSTGTLPPATFTTHYSTGTLPSGTSNTHPRTATISSGTYGMHSGASTRASGAYNTRSRTSIFPSGTYSTQPSTRVSGAYKTQSTTSTFPSGGYNTNSRASVSGSYNPHSRTSVSGAYNTHSRTSGSGAYNTHSATSAYPSRAHGTSFGLSNHSMRGPSSTAYGSYAGGSSKSARTPSFNPQLAALGQMASPAPGSNSNRRERIIIVEREEPKTRPTHSQSGYYSRTTSLGGPSATGSGSRSYAPTRHSSILSSRAHSCSDCVGPSASYPREFCSRWNRWQEEHSMEVEARHKSSSHPRGSSNPQHGYSSRPHNSSDRYHGLSRHDGESSSRRRDSSHTQRAEVNARTGSVSYNTPPRETRHRDQDSTSSSRHHWVHPQQGSRESSTRATSRTDHEHSTEVLKNALSSTRGTSTRSSRRQW